MSVMDLSDVVLALATGTYTVTRASGVGTYVDGVFVPASTSTVDVVAGVYPLTGRELQRLPEGLRTKELRQVFTVDPLLVSAPEQRPDVVSIQGATWQVETVEDWEPAGNFYRNIVSKEPA